MAVPVRVAFEAQEPWIEKANQSWAHKGFIKGYEDGRFNPRKNLKGGETLTVPGRLTVEIFLKEGTYEGGAERQRLLRTRL